MDATPIRWPMVPCVATPWRNRRHGAASAGAMRRDEARHLHMSDAPMTRLGVRISCRRLGKHVCWGFVRRLTAASLRLGCVQGKKAETWRRPLASLVQSRARNAHAVLDGASTESRDGLRETGNTPMVHDRGLVDRLRKACIRPTRQKPVALVAPTVRVRPPDGND